MLNLDKATVENVRYCQYSATAYLTNLVVENLCNPADNASKVQKISQKVAGGICMAGLMMLAVIEHVARLIICAIAALPIYYLKSEWCDKVEAYSFASWIHLAYDPLCLAKGFVLNCTGDQFDYDSIDLYSNSYVVPTRYTLHGFIPMHVAAQS